MKSSLLSAAILLLAAAAPGQIVGPDVVVTDLPGISNYGGLGGTSAVSVGTYACNLGDQVFWWIASNNMHPVIVQNLYRVKNGSFEQIGLSWAKHGFGASNGGGCGVTCVPAPGNQLGVGCSDVYGAATNGAQAYLGPRFDVNPTAGLFPYPPTLAPPATLLGGRLQARDADLDPVQNPAATWFVEAQFIQPEDAVWGNDDNNACHRRVSIVPAAGGFGIAAAGNATSQPAIVGWQALDPLVQLRTIDVPGDGRFIVGFRALPLGGGVNRYVYAVHNLNSDRAAGEFVVGMPAGAPVTNTGFHDVDYHGGEVLDGADWTAAAAANGVSWSVAAPAAVNPLGNAIRYGTCYTFTVESSAVPLGFTIGLFKPGVPLAVSGAAFSVPVPLWQENQSQAHLDVNALSNNALTGPIRAVLPTNAPAAVHWSSTLPGSPFDIVLSPLAAVPDPAGTPDGQRVNLDLVQAPVGFLFGGFAAPAPPAPVTLAFVTPPSPFLVSAQMVVLDPASPIGSRLSAAVELTVLNCVPGSQPLALGDDTFVAVPVGAGTPHPCVASIPFAGTSHTTCFVNSNGSVSFGAGSSDYTPTAAEFTAQMPRLAGMWTDLNPAVGGTVTVTSAAGVLGVAFANVPQYGTSNLSSLTLNFQSTTGSCSISGYAPSPAHGLGTLAGISPGNGAAPIPVTFGALAGAGLQTGGPGSAVFQFVAAGAPSGYTSVTFPNADGTLFLVN